MLGTSCIETAVSSKRLLDRLLDRCIGTNTREYRRRGICAPNAVSQRHSHKYKNSPECVSHLPLTKEVAISSRSVDMTTMPWTALTSCWRVARTLVMTPLYRSSSCVSTVFMLSL